MMVIALGLPMKKFFHVTDIDAPAHLPSTKLVGFWLITTLTLALVFYAWISLGVLYQIPVTMLNVTNRLPHLRHLRINTIAQMEISRLQT
jgi:hypothetical protein